MSRQETLQSMEQRHPAGPLIHGLVVRRACACGNHAPGGECEKCSAKKQSLQRSDDLDSDALDVPSIVYDVLRSSGHPLDIATRSFMEPRFGHDFSQVRVHTDETATQSARAVGARAYAVGTDVVFDKGQYAPATQAGKTLLAHELTHVVQQRESTPFSGHELMIGRPDDASEREAEALVPQVMGAEPKALQPNGIRASALRLARDFNKDLEIRHALAHSREFAVPGSTVTVVIHGIWKHDNANPLASGCSQQPYFFVTLDPDDRTYPVPVGKQVSRTWTSVVPGTYKLTIWTNNTNPHCSLEGSVALTTSARSPLPAVPLRLPAEACYDGDFLYVSKAGRTHACPALTGTQGLPTPPGSYCVQERGLALTRGGIRGILFQDRSKWMLLEPQFPTKRSRMFLHPGMNSVGCVTVTDQGCFDLLSEILHDGPTTSGVGYEGYPPGNEEGVENSPREIRCIGTLVVVQSRGDCTRASDVGTGSLGTLKENFDGMNSEAKPNAESLPLGKSPTSPSQVEQPFTIQRAVSLNQAVIPEVDEASASENHISGETDVGQRSVGVDRLSTRKDQMAALLAVARRNATQQRGYCYKTFKKNVAEAGGYGDILNIYSDSRFRKYQTSPLEFVQAVRESGEDALGLEQIIATDPLKAEPGTILVLKGNGKQSISQRYGDISVVDGIRNGAFVCYNDGILELPAESVAWSGSGRYADTVVAMYVPVVREADLGNDDGKGE